MVYALVVYAEKQPALKMLPFLLSGAKLHLLQSTIETVLLHSILTAKVSGVKGVTFLFSIHVVVQGLDQQSRRQDQAEMNL